MSKWQEMKKLSAGLSLDIAVVQVKPGESPQEAWLRHIKENPGDISALAKIFKHLVPPCGPDDATTTEKAEKF